MHLTHDPAAPAAPTISFDQFLAVDIRVGRAVAAVVNFPPRQIGKFISEVLTLGFPDENGAVVLFSPDRDVPIGGRLF